MATWREITDLLASRMFHHAFCEQHPEASADPDCPFCRDRAAYRAWETKSGRTHREPEYTGEVFDALGHALEGFDVARTQPHR